MNRPRIISIVLILAVSGASRGSDLSPAELKLKQVLGEGTPDPIPLWPGKPPRFVEQARAELVDDKPTIRMISVPTITPYLPPQGKGTGMALIICPGGGYGAMDWRTHVVYAAKVFNPMGVAVIGLKYRTRPPNGKSNDEIQEIALLDVKRAVRLARARAAEWKLDPRKIGVAGYSAGADVAMNLAANFDRGDAQAADPIERQSSRPDFVVGLATWHWRKKESPFTFGKETPPVFLVHASNDGIGGGAPIELPRAIAADLTKLGVPVHLEVFAEGGHGVGNLIPQRVQHGFPGAQWPGLVLKWLETVKENPAAAGDAPAALEDRPADCDRDERTLPQVSPARCGGDGGRDVRRPESRAAGNPQPGNPRRCAGGIRTALSLHAKPEMSDRAFSNQAS